MCSILFSFYPLCTLCCLTIARTQSWWAHVRVWSKACKLHNASTHSKRAFASMCRNDLTALWCWCRREAVSRTMLRGRFIAWRTDHRFHHSLYCSHVNSVHARTRDIRAQHARSPRSDAADAAAVAARAKGRDCADATRESERGTRRLHTNQLNLNFCQHADR